MKKMLFICGSFFLLLVGCTKSDNPSDQRAAYLRKSKGSVTIAAAAPWGMNRNLLQKGIELACIEINDNGGIMNRPLEVRFFDDLNDEAAGQIVAYDIASNKEICAVLGHSSSSVSAPNALLYHYYGLMMISPLSTGTSLTEQGFDKVFRNIPSDAVLGQEAARFCATMGWKNIVVYYDFDAYGESLSNAFERQCTLLSIDVLDRSGYSHSMSRIDFEETVNFWKRNHSFDAVFIAGTFPKVGEIIETIRSNGVSCPIIGGEAFDHPAMFHINSTMTNNVYAVTMYDSESSYQPFQTFRVSFLNKYGSEPDMAALQGYDAVKVFAHACDKAQSIIPSEVGAAIHNIITWEGPAGPYQFTKSGDIIGKKLVIKKVFDNKFVVLNTLEKNND